MTFARPVAEEGIEDGATMKTLFILRHAKSSWDDPEASDHDRPLNKRGREAAKRLGKFTRARALVPDLVLASSALRAQQTVELWSQAAGYTGPVQTHRELYLADPERYITLVRALGTEPEKVMVVGHNPGLEQLVEVLTGKVERFPTAALAEVHVDAAAWRDLGADVPHHLAALWRVKELKS